MQHIINPKENLVSFIEEVGKNTFAKYDGVYLCSYADWKGDKYAIVTLGPIDSQVVRHIPENELIFPKGVEF